MQGNGNGDGAALDKAGGGKLIPLESPQDYVDFNLAGDNYRVPVISLWHMGFPEVSEPLRELSPDQLTQDYARSCLKLVLAVLAAEGHQDLPAIEDIARRTRGGAFGLQAIMRGTIELLRKSGFLPEGEAEATAASGTGIQMPSSPSLPSEGSAVATPG